jgi:ankyrin repeat protein
MSNINALNLIKSKKWKLISKLVTQDKLDIKNPIYKNYTVIQYATIHNDEKTINNIWAKDPNAFTQRDHLDNTILHLASRFGNLELLVDIAHKMPKLMSYTNVRNENVFHELTNYLTIKKLLTIAHDNNIDIKKLISAENYNLHTPITLIMNASEDDRDEAYKILKLYLDYKPDLDIPKIEPPVIWACFMKKFHLLKLLIDHKVNINGKNIQYMSALTSCVVQNNIAMAKYLLEQGIDYNYAGSMGEYNVIEIAIFNKNNEMLELLLSYKPDLKKYDNHMNTPLHYLYATYYQEIKVPIRMKICKLSDLRIQNELGNTGLHLILKYENWQDFKDALKNKKLDIYAKNKMGELPLSFLADKDTFINFVTDNYIKMLKKDQEYLYAIDLECRDTADKCRDKIRNNIIKTGHAYPITKYPTNIFFKEWPEVNHTLWASSYLHSMIYTIIILSKYRGLFVPYMTRFDNGENNYSLFNGLASSINEDVLKTQFLLPELMNFSIIWYDENNYYYSKYLDIGIQKCYYAKPVRYIWLDVSIIVSKLVSHANLLLFDKETNILERFDPTGYKADSELDKLDDLIDENIKTIFENITGKKVKYIRPRDYLTNAGFQVLAKEYDNTVKNLGDPGGYCLAWVLWYLELRMTNDAKNGIKNLVDKALKKINAKYRTLLDFIRNYAHYLDKEKNKWFVRAGIEESKFYAMSHSGDDLNKIKQQLYLDFNDLVWFRCC